MCLGVCKVESAGVDMCLGVRKVESAGVPEKLTSTCCTEVDDEPSSSLVWVPESCSNETVSESTSQPAPLAKVEAVTLMLSVQPGITVLP